MEKQLLPKHLSAYPDAPQGNRAGTKTAQNSRGIRTVFLTLLLSILCGLGSKVFAVGSVTHWYLLSSCDGNINETTNWTQDYTGATASGTLTTFAPSSGSTYFHIRNVANATLGASLTIGGGGGTAYIFVGDSTDAVNFTVPAAYTLTNGSASISVSPNATLTILNTTVPTLNTMATGSTVAYSAAGSQTVQGIAYSNLTMGGSGTRTVSSAVTVNATVAIIGSSTVGGVSALTYSSNASLVYNTASAYTTGGELSTNPPASLVVESGTVTASSTVGYINTVNGNVTINSGATLNMGSNYLVLYGSLFVNGTISGGASINFSGTGNFTCSGFTDNVAVNLSPVTGTQTLTLTGPISVALLDVEGNTGTTTKLFLGTGLKHSIASGISISANNDSLFGGNDTVVTGGFGLSGPRGVFVPQTSTVIETNSGLISGETYYNLILTAPGSFGTHYLGSNYLDSIIINHMLFIGSGDTMIVGNIPIVDGGSCTITNNGELQTSVVTTLNATPIPAGKTWGGVVAYNSSSGSQTIVAGTYSVITTNNATSLGGNVSASSLSLNGIVTTGANTLSMLNSGSISGAGSSRYIYGNLSKAISGASSVTYEIGDASEYLPGQLTLSSSGTGGSLGMSVTGGSEPHEGTSYISGTQNVNAYWTITNNSATGPATVTPKVTYNSDDITGGSNASFAMEEYASGSWSPSTIPCTNSSGGSYSSAASSGVALASVAGDYVFGVSNAPCYGTPTGGTPLVTPGDGNVSSAFTLSLSGETTATGITYQWQSSTGSGYTNITGATNATYNFTGITGNTMYQCVLTCPTYTPANSGTVTAVYFSPGASCTPSAAGAAMACSFEAGIVSFDLTGASGSISDNAACNSTGYVDNITEHCTLDAATTYTATVTTGTNITCNLQVWIDFNGDGTFQSSESVGGVASAFEGTTNVALTIPAGVAGGTYRMRVVIDPTAETHAYPNIDPCTSGYNYSEARDYSITIPGGVSWNNVAGTSVCVGNNVTLTDATSGGTWSSTNTSVATIGTGGVVNGVAAGTSTISYAYSGGGGDIQVVTVNASPAAVSGTYTVSPGNTVALSDAITGGSWSSSNTSVATVDGTGLITGVSAGTATITYAIGSCFTTVPVSVLLNYCIPSPSQASPSCSSYQLVFESVNLTGVSGSISDNVSCNGSGYLNNTSLSCTLQASVTYPVAVTTGLTYGVYTQFWIDFNNDGIFQSSESVGGNTTGFVASHDIAITIPATVAGGTYRMRGVLDYESDGHYYPNMDPCMAGYTWGEARDYTVTILPLLPCTGTPVPGTAVVTPAFGNSATPMALGLTGQTVASGITYQWQSSATGGTGTFTNISGATSDNYSFTGISANTWYQCVETCASYSPATSNTATATYLVAPSCIPSPSQAASSCSSYQLVFESVNLAGASSSISDNVSCNGSGYLDNTSLSCYLLPSVTYTVVVGTGSSFGAFTQFWIDFNNNGIFESSEIVGGNASPISGPGNDIVITIPATVTSGIYRMRGVLDYQGDNHYYPDMDPCMTGYGWGEARDYTVIVPPICSGIPTAGTATISPTSGIGNTNFSLGLSGNTVALDLNYQWQLSGTGGTGTFSSIAGATNSSYSFTGIDSNTWYNCIVTCPSFTPATSSAVTATFVPVTPCIPAPISASATCGFGIYFMSVYLQGLFNPLYDAAACSGTGYENETALSCVLGADSTYTMTVTTGTSYNAYSQFWVDFNKDGYFEPGESVGGSGLFSGATNVTITVPSWVSPGTYKMRGVIDYSGDGHAYPNMDPCMVGYNIGDARDYTVIIAPQCSGVPTAGTATISPTNGIGNTTFDLGLSGSTIALGLNYQWQSSVTGGGGTFSDIPGATNLAYSFTGIDSSVWLRCNVTCPSFATATSNTVTAAFVPVTPCIPAPIYAAASCSGFGMSFASVYLPGIFSPLNDMNSCNGTGYLDETALGTALAPGNTYTMTITTVGYGYNEYSQFWVDFNKDGYFEPGETVGGTADFNGITTLAITIPSWVSPGNYKMRGVIDFDGEGHPYPTMDPCMVGYQYGEARDYTLIVSNASFTTVAGANIMCIGGNTTLTDTAGGGIWSSANTSVASVSSAGVVTGVSAGTAVITYTTASSGDLRVVTVNPMQPTVSSVSPLVGYPSSAVSITGANFNTTAVNNSVYFGATQATVTSASATSLSVAVPVGSTYAPVTVTNLGCNLTVSSELPYLSTYNNSGYVSGTQNFDTAVHFTGPNNTQTTAIGDMNGDGKPDIVADDWAGNLYVYLNTSSAGSIAAGSFSLAATFSDNGTGGATQLVLSDIDGDGKLDIVVINYNNQASVTRNTTTGGVLSFDPALIFTCSEQTDVAVGDIDGDGKPDIVGVGDGGISVVRNTSTVGSISFAGEDVIADGGSYTGGIAIGDVDGDGKPDIAVTTQWGSTGVIVLLNGSTPGSLSFPTGQLITTAGGSPSGIVMTDVDGDGKLDLVFGDESDGPTVLLNQCSTGIISFATPVVFSAPTGWANIAVSDFDGDGKPDLIGGNGYGSISVLLNASIPGTASFTNGVAYNSGSGSFNNIPAAGDLDGDGKADIVMPNANDNDIAILRNDPLKPIVAAAYTVCAGATIAMSDATPQGSWNTSNTSVATIDPVSGLLTGVSAGVVTVTYAGTGGVSFAGNITTVNVTVNAAPSSTGATNNGPVCSGTSVTLYDNSTGATGWSWHGSDGSSSASESPVMTPTATTTYSLIMTNSDGCSSAMAYTTVVTVNMAPSSAGATNNGPVCAGTAVTLYDNSTNATGWSWHGSDGSSSSSQSPVMTPTATTTYSLTVSNSDGCSNATVYTTTVSVNSVPSSTGATNNGPICSGNSVTLYDNSTGATGWSWHGSDGSSSTIESPTMTPTATTTYSLTVTNTDACINATVYTTIVVVNTTNAGTISGASSVNAGSTITLTDAAGGGSWSSGNTSVATVAGGLVTGVAGGIATISYAVTGICGMVYATKVITVNSSSLSGITGSNTVCGGGVITLSNSTPGGTWSMESLIATIAASTGVVTASNAYSGTATVTYTLGTLHTTTVITVNPNPTPIQMSPLECVGTTTTLSDVTPGGTWSGSGDGVVSGTGTAGTFVAGSVAGSATIIYTLPTGCEFTVSRTIYANPLPITGTFNLCVGAVTNLGDASTGSNWFSSDTAVARVSGGAVTGVRTGTTTITFQSGTAGYCLAMQVVTVAAQPATITGNTGAVCPGFTLSLTDGTGTWTSGNTAIATVGSTGGVVTGISGGTAMITYLVAGTSGCIAKTTVTVSAVSAVTGTATVCPGSVTVLHDAMTGGTWSSGAVGTATVNSAGVVTGVTNGNANISYTNVSGCVVTQTVTVNGVSASISGSLSICQGTSATLSDATIGGIWSMSSSLVTINGSTGVMTASASLTGTATVSYTSGGCVATSTVTVNANPTPIQGSAAECAGLTVSLSNATSGGSWAISGDASITGTGATAMLTANSVGGTALVTYTLPTGCVAKAINTIYALPQPIQGNFNLCVGLVTILSDASPVSSWSSSSTAIAIASGADISGEGAGTATITFKTSAAGNCITTQVVTVSAMPVVTAINGPATISHAGSPVSISDATAGGIWTSSNTSVITLSGSTGSPIGASAVTTTGSSVITYAVTIAGCTTKVTRTFSAAASSHPETGGTTVVYAGSAVSVAGGLSGGGWSSSDNGVATVDGSGLVTGIMPGSATITHVITGDDGAVSTEVTDVVVNAMQASIGLVPNPNKGTFVVKGSLGSIADEEVTIEVTDVLGQVIYKDMTTAEGGKLNATISLGNTLANGMYLLNVQSKTEKQTVHFVVTR